MNKIFSYLILFFISHTLFSMETTKPSVEKIKSGTFDKALLPKVMQYIWIGKDKTPSALIEGYKKFIKLRESNPNDYLNQIIDKKNNLTRYHKYLLDNLSDKDFKRLNQYVLNSIKTNQLSKDLYLLINLLVELKKLDKTMKDESDRTILMLASMKGNKHLVDLLIKAGANVNVKNKSGETAITLAQQNAHKQVADLLRNAATATPIERLPKEMLGAISEEAIKLQDHSPKALIESYKNYLRLKNTNKQFYDYLSEIVDKEKKLTRYQQYLLSQLTKEDFEKLNEYIYNTLESNQLVPNEKYTKNMYLLMDVLTKLKKLNANERRGYYTSPIIIGASDSGYTDFVKLLIDAGAKVDEQSEYNERAGWGYSAIAYAINKGHTEIVKLLISAGANVNQRGQNGKPLLKEAKLKGKQEIVDLLQASGAKE